MASSKKYGYQLRGNNLALCELDVAGSSDGLNYTYTEGGGLDITTDPSSWKSPLETITDGLQVEYLPSYSKDDLLPANNHDLHYTDIIGSEVIADDSFFISMSEEAMDLVTTVTHQVVTDESYTSPSSLKIAHTALQDIGVLTTNNYTTSRGKHYVVDFRIKIKATAANVNTTISSRPQLWIEVLHGDQNAQTIDSDSGEAIPLITNSMADTDLLAGKYHLYPDIYTLDTWTHIRIPYTEIAEGEHAKLFISSVFIGGDGRDYVYYIDDFTIKEQEFQGPELNEELHINLPSYAQKALLDYVRAQESYEGGDLERWDFFMKQFRSKLERWEDSRITGPRILGPSSSAIR